MSKSIIIIRLRMAVVLLPAVLLALLAAGAAHAQSTGSISGLVQDPNGASVAHAQVTARHQATNA